MEKELDIQSFLSLAETIPVIDVRSPAEFEIGHIPGAFNLPLFNNEERAIVGTLYKQKGRNEAVLAGLDIVGPKMSSLVNESKKIAVNNEVLVHCWRGGMRSGSFCWLMNTVGIKATTLKKGYKAYRQHVLQSFEKELQIIILGGETGSGKTEILKFVRATGEQVIDLEGFANHKGSSFGAIGQEPQPRPEQFENDLAKHWNTLDPERRVWLEDESKNIGRVFIPDALWNQMKLAPIIRVNVPKSERIKRLVKEYGTFDKKILQVAIERIQKRLGGQWVKRSIEALEAGDMATVADITLVYYDKAYNYNHELRKMEGVHFLEVEQDDPELNAKKVLAFADEKLSQKQLSHKSEEMAKEKQI